MCQFHIQFNDGFPLPPCSQPHSSCYGEGTRSALPSPSPHSSGSLTFRICSGRKDLEQVCLSGATSLAGTACLRCMEGQVLAFMWTPESGPDPQPSAPATRPKGPSRSATPMVRAQKAHSCLLSLCPALWPQLLTTCSPHKSVACSMLSRLRKCLSPLVPPKSL